MYMGPEAKNSPVSYAFPLWRCLWRQGLTQGRPCGRGIAGWEWPPETEHYNRNRIRNVVFNLFYLFSDETNICIYTMWARRILHGFVKTNHFQEYLII